MTHHTAKLSLVGRQALNRLTAELEAAQAALANRVRLLEVREAPVQLGAIVKSSKGRKLKVTHITLVRRHGHGPWMWAARGLLLRKDGSLGRRYGDAYWTIEE